MALYDYECTACGARMERRVSIADRDKTVVCPHCQGKMVRKPNAPLTVLWAGRFHSPWHKKQTGEW